MGLNLDDSLRRFPRIANPVLLGTDYKTLYFSPKKYAPRLVIRDSDLTDAENEDLVAIARDSETYPEYVVHYMRAYVYEDGRKKPLSIDWSYDEDYYNFILKVGDDAAHYDYYDIEERLDDVAEDAAIIVWNSSSFLSADGYSLTTARDPSDLKDDIREEVEYATYEESREIIKEMLERINFRCSADDNTYYCERRENGRKEVVIF